MAWMRKYNETQLNGDNLMIFASSNALYSHSPIAVIHQQPANRYISVQPTHITVTTLGYEWQVNHPIPIMYRLYHNISCGKLHSSNLADERNVYELSCFGLQLSSEYCHPIRSNISVLMSKTSMSYLASVSDSAPITARPSAAVSRSRGKKDHPSTHH